MTRLSLLLYKNNRTKADYFPESITICIPNSSNGTNFCLVLASAILLFRVLGKLKLWPWEYLIWHTFRIKLLHNLSIVSKV